jgi:hypothetical protein
METPPRAGFFFWSERRAQLRVTLRRPQLRNRLHIAALSFLAAAIAAAGTVLAGPAANSAESLRAKYAELGAKLEKSPFGRPLHLQSTEGSRQLAGDVYAVVDHPYAEVEKGFREAASWCDVLILPFNTKHCRATGREGATILSVRIGRKAEQPAQDAFPIDFKYQAGTRSPDYFRTVLKADAGPVGTRDYEIALEATPLDDKRTFIHLGYSYGFGLMSKLAMQAYLSTAGASKVGFTVTGRDAQGQPQLVGGMLGATERNTMRYFLAIEAYLASLAAPEASRVQKRLGDWFAATERYPRQLHEMDRGEYLAMKEKETKRLNAAL